MVCWKWRSGLAVGVCATALGGCNVGGDDKRAAPGTRTVMRHGDSLTFRQVRGGPWAVVQASVDGRRLQIAYEGGACVGSNPTVRVREGPASVVVDLRYDELVAINGKEELCAGYATFERTWFRLSRPIAGRRIRGGPRLKAGLVEASSFDDVRLVRGRYYRFVPRVVGLSAVDASQALKLQNFRVRTRGAARGQTMAQRPRPGARQRADGPPQTVWLTLRTRE